MRMSSYSTLFGGASGLDLSFVKLQAQMESALEKAARTASFADTLTALQSSEEPAAVTDAKSTAEMTMDEYKNYIYDKISNLPVHPTQTNRSASVFISEEGFSQMKENAEYEDWVIGKLREDFAVSNPLCPRYGSYVVYQFGAKKSDYRGDSWYPEFQGGQGNRVYRERSEGSFWSNHAQKKKQMAEAEEKYYAQKRMLEKMSEQLAAIRTARARMAGLSHTASDMPIFGVPAEFLLAGLGGGMGGMSGGL